MLSKMNIADDNTLAASRGVGRGDDEVLVDQRCVITVNHPNHGVFANHALPPTLRTRS